MKLIFADKLLKSITGEINEKVLSEINDFYSEYIDSGFNVRNMRSSWSVREIRGTTHIEKVYKLRVNLKDRVLFTFGKYLGLRDEFINSIIFMEFCNHDSQILRGRNINVTERNLEEQEEFENYIDELYYDYSYDLTRSISRVVSVDEIKDMIEGNDERATYYLNEQQFQLINRDLKPLFLFGSAGSGKTTISINKAYNLCGNNMKTGYFTYSDFLVEEARSVFEMIVRQEREDMEEYGGKISFNSVNGYILSQAQKPSLISYEEYEIWINNYLNRTLGRRKINLQAADVWREIRGIIKGLVAIDWMNIEIERERLGEEFIDYLIGNEFACESNSKLYIVNEKFADLNTKIQYNIRDNRESFIENLNIIYETIDRAICRSRLLDREVYLRLPKGYSIFDRDEKEFIYDLALKYDKWLESNNKIDENDAVRLAIINLYKGKGRIFDYVICDEIQDLTEMQIYFLFKIIRNKENILFCGDYNQTVNPTFFDTGRIEALFKICNGRFSFNDETITTNYRSSKNIVEFSNKLTALKKLKLGTHKKHDYPEIAVRDCSRKIVLVKADAIHREDLLTLSKRRAYLDILVADEDERENIISNSTNKLVFTVSNYKGLENEYIIGYNILSKHRDKWAEIFSGNFSSKESARYYFNLFYVFITRARNNICLIEEGVNEELLEYFKDEIKVMDRFDLSELDLVRISDADEHYKKGLRLEKNKKYMEAIESYKNAEMDSIDLNIPIRRCTALHKNLQGHHSEAAEELMEIGEYSHAADCYLAAEDYLNVIHAMSLNKNSYGEIEKVLSPMEIEPMNIVMRNQSKIHWLDKFNKIYKDHMDNMLALIGRSVFGIEGLISDINKIIG